MISKLFFLRSRVLLSTTCIMGSLVLSSCSNIGYKLVNPVFTSYDSPNNYYQNKEIRVPEGNLKYLEKLEQYERQKIMAKQIA